jgi:hypothetical protein
MADTELRKEMSELVTKIEKQYSLLKEKISNVNAEEAAKKPSIYEKFMPIVDQFQEDLVFISTKAYNIIEDLNEKLVTMFDGIDKALEVLDSIELEDDGEEIIEEPEDEILMDLEGPNVVSEINFDSKK